MLTIDPGQLDVILVVGALLLIAGVVASKLSSRLGIPALLLFLGVGMLAGSEGLGGIAFDNPDLARSVGTLALAFILFSGGLDTRWEQVQPVLGPAALLATVGVVITAGITGVIAMLVLEVPLGVGLLVGAIISSTDAAAVFSVLRSRNVALRGRLRPLLELESASNDPMAILLTIALIEWLSLDGVGLGRILTLLVGQFSVGAAFGVAAAAVLVWLMRRLHLDQQGLYPVMTLALAGLAYALSSEVGGSGFLAVYVAGVGLGRADIAHKRRLIEFHDAVAWFMQIVMFLVLGLLVFPSQLSRVVGPALAILIVLTLLARPLAVLVCLPRGWTWSERHMVAWVGLRGAAPILLATFPLVADIESGPVIFDVVFFVVLLSVLVQGTTIPQVARMLGVAAPLESPSPLAVEAVQQTEDELELLDLEVGSDAPAAGRRIVDLELPRGTLIVLLTRGEDRAIPQGSTLIQAGDRLLVLGEPAEASNLTALLSG